MAPSKNRLLIVIMFRIHFLFPIDRKPIDPEVFKLLQDDDDNDFLSESSDIEMKLGKEMNANVKKLKPSITGDGGLLYFI